jgi:hypothetical protein
MTDQDLAPPQPKEILYVDYTGSPYPQLSRWSRVPGVGAFVSRLTDDSMFRRHPRDAAYMRDLVRHAHGEEYADRIRQVSGPEGLDEGVLRSLRAIVLLWRDGNGTGWRPIERRVLRHISGSARVLVLNGRRRQFELTPGARRAYLLRRALGKSFVVEAAFFVGFVLTSPFLLLWDQARGHR